MPLYGHELSESIDPFQAGLGFAVHLEGRDFPGRDALVESAARAVAADARRLESGRQTRAARRLCGAGGRRQHGSAKSPAARFRRRSNCRSPWAIVEPALPQPGTEVAIDIRGRREPATVVALPFYRRSA